VAENALNRVEDGYVLDNQGQWITIEQAIAVEDDLHAHLWAGHVRQNGQWVSIEHAIGKGGFIEEPRKCTLLPPGEDSDNENSHGEAHIIDDETREIESSVIADALAASSGTANSGLGQQNIRIPVTNGETEILSLNRHRPRPPRLHADTRGINIKNIRETADPDEDFHIGRVRHLTFIIVFSVAFSLIGAGAFLVYRILF
jgi:hypothetical protein